MNSKPLNMFDAVQDGYVDMSLSLLVSGNHVSVIIQMITIVNY